MSLINIKNNDINKNYILQQLTAIVLFENASYVYSFQFLTVWHLNWLNVCHWITRISTYYYSLYTNIIVYTYLCCCCCCCSICIITIVLTSSSLPSILMVVMLKLRQINQLLHQNELPYPVSNWRSSSHALLPDIYNKLIWSYLSQNSNFFEALRSFTKC